MKKISRAIVLDAGYGRFGVTGELAALIGEKAFDRLDAPMTRFAAPEVPIPSNPALEPLVVLGRQQIIAIVRELTR